MPSSASVLGKIGTQSAATTHTFSNVTRMNFNCAQNLLSIYSGGQPNPCDIEIATGATITLTNTGGTYVLSIS